MSEDLIEEQEAIQSIYGPQVLRRVDDQIHVLSIPQSDSVASELALRLSFPTDYPMTRPEILGIETIGASARKGNGAQIIKTGRAILQKVFIPGSVCLFDLLQELARNIEHSLEERAPSVSDDPEDRAKTDQSVFQLPSRELSDEPKWTVSGAVTEKKSTFLARACFVQSPQQAQACIAYLLDTDKRAAKAMHNITAFRIQPFLERPHAAASSRRDIVYQSCDDDGETAAGGRLLHLLQVMDVWNVLVVVSRWYGGVKLGPDRFSIINSVAREAIVQGGWTRSRIKGD